MMKQVQIQKIDSGFIIFALACSLFAFTTLAHASPTNGTINSTYKYAWGSVTGYVNFAPTNGGLVITDSAVTGYAWSANTGWINFSPTYGGVKNDGKGVLSGFAWDSHAGWVDFTGVTIDSGGEFHGTATGGEVNGASYVINFNCTTCVVRTDWRANSYRIISASSISTTVSSTASVTTTTTPSVVLQTQPAEPPVSELSKGSEITNGKTVVSGSSSNNVQSTENVTTVAPSTDNATTATTSEKTISSSFFHFVYSVIQSIFAGIRAFFRLFGI